MTDVPTAPCPICGTFTFISAPADIALFFRVNAGIAPDQEARSFLCEDCDHVFFNPQPTEAQLVRNYSGAASEWHFNQMRIAFEAYWAEQIAIVADPDSGYWQSRRSIYAEGLGYVAPGITGTVVDFGGGTGRVTREVFPNARIEVVDVGYQGNLQKLLRSSDFLFAAHVFEHVRNPMSDLMRLTAELRPGTPVWIELPIEYEGSLTECWKATSEGPPQNALRIMHEHIHHYSEGSMKKMLSRAGLVTPNPVVRRELGCIATMAVKVA